MAKKVLLKERGTINDLHPQVFLDCIQDFPKDGKPGQVLYHNGTNLQWIDLLDLFTYGVAWKPNVGDPVLIRVGNMDFHKTLPIQSNMKGCIYNPKEKKVIYWLDEDNWKYKKGGNPDKGEVEDLARLDGYDGEVMVYVPEFWIRSWDEPTRREVRISPIRIDNTWEYQPALYLSAYRDTILHTVPENMGYLSTLEVDTAISVANGAAYCRGGQDSSSYDFLNSFRSHLGKGITHISLESFRESTRKANKEVMSYKQYKNIIYWLYVIEYANFNVKQEFNSEFTSEGYHQGGLGYGLTNLLDTNDTWSSYNGKTLICPNGYTNEFGNKTNIKLISDRELNQLSYGGKIYATRYRGIENICGDTMQEVDGIIVDCDTDIASVYITNNPTKYGDTTGIKPLMKTKSEGYIKEWNLGSTAEIIPRLIDASTTKYKCSFHDSPSSGTNYIVAFGGNVIDYALAGLGSFWVTTSNYFQPNSFRSVSVI